MSTATITRLIDFNLINFKILKLNERSAMNKKMFFKPNKACSFVFALETGKNSPEMKQIIKKGLITFMFQNVKRR